MYVDGALISLTTSHCLPGVPVLSSAAGRLSLPHCPLGPGCSALARNHREKMWSARGSPHRYTRPLGTRYWLDTLERYAGWISSASPQHGAACRVTAGHVCHACHRVTCLTVTCDAAPAVSPCRLVLLVAVPAWQVQALVTPGARTTLHTCSGGRKYFLGLGYIFITTRYTHGGATNSNAFPTALYCSAHGIRNICPFAQ